MTPDKQKRMRNGGLGWLATITPELPKRQERARIQSPQINSNARTFDNLPVCALVLVTRRLAHSRPKHTDPSQEKRSTKPTPLVCGLFRPDRQKGSAKTAPPEVLCGAHSAAALAQADDPSGWGVCASRVCSIMEAERKALSSELRRL